MTNRVFKFFSSLRLTVVLLSLALVLVFIGTMAQVKLGLYVAQEDYFRSLFVFWQPNGASWKVPVFPGGWLLGGMLLANLIAAHIKRFQFTKKKIGIFLIHGGLIFLLLGQFFTEIFQVESNLRLEEGETRNYSESARLHEIAIVDVSNPDHDEVVAIPESLVAEQKEISHPKLPFTIRVKEYFENSRTVESTLPAVEGKKMQASSGTGSDAEFVQVPITASMEEKNVPSVLLELVSDKGSVVGEWVASLWLNEQTIDFNGRTYRLSLRPIRYYRPYNITLLDFRHDVYPGTAKPSNFSSKIHLSDPTRGEERDVLIKMNEPLRYAGETYFQASFDEFNDKVTILQVVRNPAAITPYVACSLMGLGLLVQFLMHLITFGRREKNKTSATPKIPSQRKSATLTERRETV